MTRIAERVARNASYSLAANVVAFAAGAASSVLLARLLGPAGFGTYALVLMAGGILGMLVTLGLPHAATKYVSEFEGRGERQTAGRLLAALARVELALALAGGTAAFLAAPWLERAFGAPGFAGAFRIAAAGLPLAALAGLLLAGLQGFQDYRRTALISLAGTLFLFCSTVGLLLAGAGVAGAVGALAATGALTAALAWWALRRHGVRLPREGSLSRGARVKLRRYVPAVSAVLLLDAVVWQRSEVFFLGLFRTPSEVAWYALAFGVAATVMRLLPRSLSFVLPPVASGLYGADDRAGLRALFGDGSRYLLVLAAPLIAGGALLAEPLLTTVYGEPYAPAARALPLVLLAAGFGAVGSVTAAIQTGVERQDLVLKVAVVATVANVALDLALIPRWGVVGAALANGAAQIGAVVAGIALTARLLETRFPLADCARIVAAAGAVAVAAYGIAHALGGGSGLAVGIVAAAAAYPIALVLLGALRPDDLERLHAVGNVLPPLLRPSYGGLLRLARWAP